MVMKVATPEKVASITEKVWQRIYGGSNSGRHCYHHNYHPKHRRRCSYESEDEYEDEDGTIQLMQMGAERSKNVLILMSDTGGGHRASAEAIRDAFRIEFGDEYRIYVKDVWKEYTGWPLNDMERSYKFMVKHVQLWKVAFHGTSPRWIHSSYLAAIASYYANEVERGLMEYKPDIIISVHPLMQHIPLLVLKWKGLQKKVIFVTVITDLNTCHRTWFHPRVNRCYCPSKEVAKRALYDGLQDSQVRVFGLPVRPSFARAVLSKDDLRRELELDPDLPTVLLMGGGEGMGPVRKQRWHSVNRYTIKSTETNRAIDHNMWPKQRPCFNIGIPGMDDPGEGQRAGPGTIAEALIRGLPIVLNDYIPGQEKGNVPYVVDNGAGVFTRSPKETARIVSEWFSIKTDELKRMSENALKLTQPEAVFDIVKDIHELACQRRHLANISYVSTSAITS
ncbi:putative monogalactosyldiacylglycerol synthase 2 [Hibiscus syriacus]|uniref:Monogalactosyldiacylglycerol synthase 2 n=1 Tax=Hibiscus syriacus TaxID=106335 RepID=A0A6A3BBM3_HIBSY|nr:putative monogalactosyldiacylglycerol synthase 2 [Hibiscus syriacus]